MNTRARSRLTLLGLSLWVSCYNDTQLRSQLTALTLQVQQQSSTIYLTRKEMDKIARRAFCPQEIKTLLEDVRDNAHCSPDSICMSELIGAYANQTDPSGQGRFMSLMSSQPYVVLYPRLVAADGKSVLKLDQPQLDRQRLRNLVSPPWLDFTKFVIVANKGKLNLKDLASERIKFALNVLGELGFPEYPGHRIDAATVAMCSENEKASDRQVIRWAFKFSLRPGEQLHVFDQPPKGRTIDDAVIVFRVDCPLAPMVKRKP